MAITGRVGGSSIEAALKKFVDRYLTAQAVFLVSLAVAVNAMWIVFLGWLLYQMIRLLSGD